MRYGFYWFPGMGGLGNGLVPPFGSDTGYLYDYWYRSSNPWGY